MKLFFAFLVLAFLGGLIAWPNEKRMRWYLAGLCLALAVGFYVFHKI